MKQWKDSGTTYAIALQNESDDGLSHVRLLRPTRRSSAATEAAVVMIDIAMFFALFVLVVYLWHGGLNEFQGWWVVQAGR